jgi:hypothetical protein
LRASSKIYSNITNSSFAINFVLKEKSFYYFKNLSIVFISLFFLPALLNDPNNHLPNFSESESKLNLGHISPNRLSPNLFLNLNFDQMNTSSEHLDHRGISGPMNNLTFEWSNFNPLSSVPSLLTSSPAASTTCTITAPSHSPSSLLLSSTSSKAKITSYIPHLNNLEDELSTQISASSYSHHSNHHVATPYDDEMKFLNFNLDSFKNECILNLEQSILDQETADSIDVGGTSHGLADLQTYEDLQSMKTSSSASNQLLDLEKPINIQINVGNLDEEVKY